MIVGSADVQLAKQILFFSALMLFFTSASAFEMPQRKWLALDLGLIGRAVEVSAADDVHGWGVSLANYEQFFFSQAIDARTDQRVDPKIDVFGLSRIWRHAHLMGNVVLGVGVAYARGQWGRNCVNEPGFLTSIERCDIEKISTLGIPLHASITLGRYAGIGLFVRSLYTTKSRSAMAGITFSFGQF